MTEPISRRRFLRSSAGGITFLALSPLGGGLFSAFDGAKTTPIPVPLFTALPYLQPGEIGALAKNAETCRLAWQTERRHATFDVRFGMSKRYEQRAVVTSAERFSGDAEEGEGRINYVATLPALELGRRYQYQVRCNDQTIAEGYFTTRQGRGRPIRFAAFGDNSFGEISDRAIAYHTYLANPDFVMNTGDNVYEGGLDNEYARYFFPVYNADVAGQRIGAPLLRSVPFHTVIANHDVHDHNVNKHPVADFDKNPDSLAYYTNLYLPLNGPFPPQPTPAIGKIEHVERFKAAAGARFPRMANYSYDFGDAHLLCLDSNLYVDPTNANLQQWITADLSQTDAVWKFVVFHHPSFNVGLKHYEEQQMRVLTPIFEEHGVDFVLHGHEHTYQRTCPFRFTPTEMSKAAAVNEKDRRVEGRFRVDEKFDGQTRTKPDGIIYITTGAGGKHLYDGDFTDAPSKWRRREDKNVAYVARFISDRHSLSIFDVDGRRLQMRQIDEYGQEIDRIRVTK